MADPTGEADRGALRLDFDRRVMLQFGRGRMTFEVSKTAAVAFTEEMSSHERSVLPRPAGTRG